ncbi:inositol polyphosphate kinase [Anaeramoeba flamelloides]|uniref:Kinase n=1 Tax=Anaeramoeba flamelloides TaxID=1746091 RepID=A0AAV8AAK1_9EUKA|nr:inositol polyphosphate kinase [Anaeramoeba flamelloides]
MSVAKHQVGGRGSILELPSSRLAKPISYEEGNFYSTIQNNEKYLPLRPFLPHNYGFFDASDSDLKRIRTKELKVVLEKLSNLELVEQSKDNVRYFVMENLTLGMRKPCLMDIKMGRRCHDFIDGYEKKIKKIKKCKASTSWPCGFRLIGLKKFNHKTGAYERRDPEWGVSLTKEQSEDPLRIFLNNGLKSRVDIAQFFLQKLKKLRSVLRLYTGLRFYTSSLLFIYDAFSNKANLRLIDFTHSHTDIPEGEEEDGYLFGVENLIKILKKIINEKK